MSLIQFEWTEPTFAESDIANFFEIPENQKLNSSLGGRQLLYTDVRYEKHLETVDEQSEAWDELHMFDGYTFFQQMSWQLQDNQLEQTRGLFTEIPERGYVGWICHYIPNEDYECYSRYIDLADFHLDFVPDLSVEQPGEELYEPYRYEGNWVCEVTINFQFAVGITDQFKDYATCTSWLPGDWGSSDYPPMFRFSPEVGPVKQYGYYFEKASSENDAWIDLDSRTLSGAVRVAPAVFSILFTLIY